MIGLRFFSSGSPVETPPEPVVVLEIDAQQILRLIFDSSTKTLGVNHAGKGTAPGGAVTDLDARQVFKEIFDRDMVKIKVVS